LCQAIPEQERRVLHLCVELTLSAYGAVMVTVTFVCSVRKPTVGGCVGTSKPSAVPVVKAKKVTVSPFVTNLPPPGNVCWVSPRLAMEPPMEAGISTQVTTKVPQGPSLVVKPGTSHVFTFSVTVTLPVFTEPPDTLTLEAGIEPEPPALNPPPKSNTF
jgi:hypothetical protein